MQCVHVLPVANHQKIKQRELKFVARGESCKLQTSSSREAPTSKIQILNFYAALGSLAKNGSIKSQNGLRFEIWSFSGAWILELDVFCSLDPLSEL